VLTWLGMTLVAHRKAVVGQDVQPSAVPVTQVKHAELHAVQVLEVVLR